MVKNDNNSVNVVVEWPPLIKDDSYTITKLFSLTHPPLLVSCGSSEAIEAFCNLNLYIKVQNFQTIYAVDIVNLADESEKPFSVDIFKPLQCFHFLDFQ